MHGDRWRLTRALDALNASPDGAEFSSSGDCLYARARPPEIAQRTLPVKRRVNMFCRLGVAPMNSLLAPPSARNSTSVSCQKARPAAAVMRRRPRYRSSRNGAVSDSRHATSLGTRGRLTAMDPGVPGRVEGGVEDKCSSPVDDARRSR
jgi:hypothetical protein